MMILSDFFGKEKCNRKSDIIETESGFYYIELPRITYINKEDTFANGVDCVSEWLFIKDSIIFQTEGGKPLFRVFNGNGLIINSGVITNDGFFEYYDYDKKCVVKRNAETEKVVLSPWTDDIAELGVYFNTENPGTCFDVAQEEKNGKRGIIRYDIDGNLISDYRDKK